MPQTQAPAAVDNYRRVTSTWTPTPATKNEPPGWTSPTGRHYTSKHQDGNHHTGPQVLYRISRSLDLHLPQRLLEHVSHRAEVARLQEHSSPGLGMPGRVLPGGYVADEDLAGLEAPELEFPEDPGVPESELPQDPFAEFYLMLALSGHTVVEKSDRKPPGRNTSWGSPAGTVGP
ncbi:hypothetical protein [Pseudarthrobacter sp. NS4]|uniref:hypothetical protein n=1 Tax=Pseudarthrobacter sp. NS4 TaxID=2973976 RepID=UPI002161D394|nr:hypothetical protein [Pseudarthrobacter sp. NS4]